MPLCTWFQGSVTYCRELRALQCMAAFQIHALETQCRVTHPHGGSTLQCMAELQTHGFTFKSVLHTSVGSVHPHAWPNPKDMHCNANAVLHTSVGEVHCSTWPNCKHMRWHARPCYTLPCNKRIGIAWPNLNGVHWDANPCSTLLGQIPLESMTGCQIHALTCKAVLRIIRKISEMACMAALQIHELKHKAVLHNVVEQVHWNAWPNSPATKYMQLHSRLCCGLPWHTCIAMHVK